MRCTQHVQYVASDGTIQNSPPDHHIYDGRSWYAELHTELDIDGQRFCARQRESLYAPHATDPEFHKHVFRDQRRQVGELVVEHALQQTGAINDD